VSGVALVEVVRRRTTSCARPCRRHARFCSRRAARLPTGGATAIPAIALPILAWQGHGQQRALVGLWPSSCSSAVYAGMPLMLGNGWYPSTRLVGGV
jgi:hypothetical protein